MPLVVPNWLADHVELAPDADVHNISAALVKVGIEEEEVHGAAVTGPLVVGKVLAKNPEPQKNGKVINWCLVDVGPEHNTNDINGVTAQQLKEANAPATGARGIVCGAHNFEVGDYVVVSLPGTVLPGPFPIAARKTYGHVSDGMICSTAELGLPDDGADGIIVLARPSVEEPEGRLETTGINFKSADLTPGQNAIELLGLGDETLEVNVTPDRGYQFSYRGMAREYGLATGAKFTDPVIALAAQVPPPTSDAFPVEIDDDAPIRGVIGCDRFATRIVNNINPKAPTPKWMQQRLEQSGMRSISLPVDITNYVMLDLGQPVHAYDLDKVIDPIVVRRAKPGERLTTLDGIERTLDAEDLLITDSDSPSVEPVEPIGTGARVLGLAGVMGGASTEISDTTKNVLVECAHFDPVTVARTARRHKLPTEAAKRFERGVDPDLPPVAAQMVVDLLVKYAGGTCSAEVGDEDATTTPQPITLKLSLPQQIVGVQYSPETIRNVLESIGARVELDTTASFCGHDANASGSAEPQKRHFDEPVIEVTPPTWRPDLTEPVDLVEEIVRIDGYDKVPSTLPAAPGGRGLTFDQRMRRSIARTLAEAGLVEVLTYPFVGSKDWEAIRTPHFSSSNAKDDGDNDGEVALRLANPLNADKPDMRNNLLITLLDAARRNYQRGLTDFGIFEIGLVTNPNDSYVPQPALNTDRSDAERTEVTPLPGNKHLVPPVGARPDDATLRALHGSIPVQNRHVAGVLVGNVEPGGWWGAGRKADWSDALGLAQLVADRAGLELSTSGVGGAGPSWHPGRSADLAVSDTWDWLGGCAIHVGRAGELHPKVAAAFGLPPRTVAFEIDLTALEACRRIDKNGGPKDVTVKAVPVSAFPVAKEDFAFVVPSDVNAIVVESAIREGAGELLESVNLFDIFTGAQLGEGQKSLAFSVRLRATDRTLTDDDVKGTRDRIIAAAQAVGAELRA